MVEGSSERNVFGPGEGGKGERGKGEGFCLATFDIIRILGFWVGGILHLGWLSFLFFSRLGENGLLLYSMSISNIYTKIKKA